VFVHAKMHKRKAEANKLDLRTYIASTSIITINYFSHSMFEMMIRVGLSLTCFIVLFIADLITQLFVHCSVSR
jgi:hypothetical protein